MKKNFILFSALMFGCGDKEDSAELSEEATPEEEVAPEEEAAEEEVE
jgi:hypothetical protein